MTKPTEQKTMTSDRPVQESAPRLKPAPKLWRSWLVASAVILTVLVCGWFACRAWLDRSLNHPKVYDQAEARDMMAAVGLAVPRAATEVYLFGWGFQDRTFYGSFRADPDAIWSAVEDFTGAERESFQSECPPLQNYVKLGPGFYGKKWATPSWAVPASKGCRYYESCDERYTFVAVDEQGGKVYVCWHRLVSG